MSGLLVNRSANSYLLVKVSLNISELFEVNALTYKASG